MKTFTYTSALADALVSQKFSRSVVISRLETLVTAGFQPSPECLSGVHVLLEPLDAEQKRAVAAAALTPVQWSSARRGNVHRYPNITLACKAAEVPANIFQRVFRSCSNVDQEIARQILFYLSGDASQDAEAIKRRLKSTPTFSNIEDAALAARLAALS